MDSGNVVIDSDMAYPILFIPKNCTTLETNCELMDNVYIEVNISSPDTEGNDTSIYSGFCNIKVVETYEVNLNHVESPDSSTREPDIEQMPVILSEANQQFPPYNQSQVWIDPSRSPYVYNHCNPGNQEQYSIHESGGLITVQQHNTYITQNVYNCKESNVHNYKEASEQSPAKDYEYMRYKKVQEMGTTAPMDTNMSYYEEDEFQCGVFLSQLPEEIMNEEQTRAREKKQYAGYQSNALKQLMSSDMQPASKQRKTIMFLGHDSHSGQTIQNISYNDPLVKCTEMEVDNEVIIDTSSPYTKKKYQCDKCKQIFDQISSFRMHMVRDHTNFKVSTLPEDKLSFMCTYCGKNLKNQNKFKIHCLGHGDPDLECSKCRKVFASKFSLRIHMRIHNRKYPCNYCMKSFTSLDELKTHLKKIHFVYMCQDENCSNVSGQSTDLNEHFHKTEVNESEVNESEVNESEVNEDIVIDEDIEVSELKSEGETLDQDMSASRLAISNQALAGPCQDLSSSDHNLAESNQDLSRSSHDFMRSSHDDMVVSNQDLAGPSRDLSSSSHNLAGSNQDLSRSSHDYKRSSYDMARSSEDLTPTVKENEGERIRKADSVIAKVMSNKIFLVSSKKAKRYRCGKTCEVCLKRFDRIDDLKRHLIEHVIRSTLAKTPVSRAGTLNITCEICQTETFNKVDKYKGHLREHAKLTIYKCTFCDKSFSDSSNFSKHKKIHGVSYLQCDLCHRKFNSKKMITQHMDHHNKTLPVQCNYCHKMFHFQSMLNKHIRCVHKQQECSKIRCRFCEDIFKSLKDKWDHEWEVHNVRKMVIDCLICGSQYRKYSELKRHCLDEHEVVIQPVKKFLKKIRLRKVSFD